MSKDTRKSKISNARKKANQILTQFIREIAEEEHERVETVDEKTGDFRVVTKGEALARLIWKSALGYVEQIDIVDKQTGKVVGKKPMYFPPDKTYVTMIFDRLEGKVPIVEAEKDGGKASVADKISGQTKSRLNKLAKK